MKKIILGIIVIAGLVNISQVLAVSENGNRVANEVKNDIKNQSFDSAQEINLKVKENVKEKLVTRAGELKLFKGKKIVVTQGELTAIDGTTLTLKKDDATYKVLTDDKTQFRRKFWGKSEISEFSTGDKLNIIGLWTDDTKTIIQALIIKDISIQMRHGTFFGTVKSISGNTIVIESGKRGEQTITVSDSTKIVNRKQEKILITDILVGHKIRVKGLWNSLKSTITESTQVKDFSIPVQPKSSVLPTVTPKASPAVVPSTQPSIQPSISPSPVPSPTV